MAGKGFDYYRNTYTHEQLWEMLVTQGDPWSVEQAGSVWTTAKGGLEAAREKLDTSMVEVVDYWQGPASEEFQRRMRIVYEYSQSSEEDMMQAADVTIPGIAQDLRDAQDNAQGQDLSPLSALEYEDWLEEVKNVKPEDPDYLSKQEQYKTEYEQYKSDRHDKIAQIVANLGDKYSSYKETLDPPPPPPGDMPGNTSYQPPTGGVFGQDGLAPEGPAGEGGPNAPGAAEPAGADLNGDGIPDAEQNEGDLEPVPGEWTPGSYDDIDSGGLAGGGYTAIGGGGFSGGGTMPPGGGTTTGGTHFGGGSGGLFGPGSGGGGRGGSTGPGRGGGTGTTNSPARSGANGSGGRGGSGSGGRGGTGGGGGRGGSGTGGRMSPTSSGRGMNNKGMMPRGGTRSGYNDDDEEETTHETWLREDDMNWSRNHTPNDELDD